MNYLSALFVILISVVSRFYPLRAGSGKDPFILHGSIVGMDTGRIVLQYPGSDGYICDTAVITGGRFQFRGYVDGAAYALLVGNLKSKVTDDPNNTLLFLEPGDLSITFKYNDAANARFKGSKSRDKEQSNGIMSFITVKTSMIRMTNRLFLTILPRITKSLKSLI